MTHIQNLVNAYLENPPKIQYENVPFPNLPKQSDWISDGKTKK
jgi:hypothetical protein